MGRSEHGIADDVAKDIAIRIDDAIFIRRRVRNCTSSLDPQMRIQQRIGDLLYDAKRAYRLNLDGNRMNMLIEQVMEVAQARDALA